MEWWLPQIVREKSCQISSNLRQILPQPFREMCTVKRLPTINTPPYTLGPMLGCFLTFLAISWLKILEGENVLFKPFMHANAHDANAHGRL